MHRILCILFLIGISFIMQAQQTAEPRMIDVVYGGSFTKDEARYPGASIFSKDNRQVQFEHQGADLWCDVAIFYQKENRLKAIGNIRMQQGDSVRMVSGFLEYEGDSRLAKAWEAVRLNNKSNYLTTDTLYFDRAIQQAYYKDGGKIIDSVNTLTSRVGRYFMETKKYQFLDSVLIVNPDYTLESKQLDYYTTSKNAYMYGPSTITGETYKMYCERGFYDTKVEQGYGIKNTEIHYNNRIIEGDSVYFDKATEFASATNHIKVTDTLNKGVIKAHYAEVHRAKDSVFATKRAVSISLVQQDSLYMHGDTLMVTGKPENRIVRAFRNAKFFKTDLSGKADSIHFAQRSGVTQFIRNPVLWNQENQMTGDSIHLLSNVKTEQLDSLKVINNAFIISQDTIGKTGFNQAKGINLYGKFEENDLRYVDLVQNTEVIYYMYNDSEELIGINYTKCSAINMILAESDIEELTFITDPDGNISPESQFLEENSLLEGFIWRGDERIRNKDEIFDEDDNNLILPVIQGIDNPIDIDAEESMRSENPSDPVNQRKPTLQKPRMQKKVG